VKLVLRVDDVGWNPDKSADRGLRFAQKFHEAMNGIPFLAAVIPACLDDDGRSWLRSGPAGVTVAMHGYKHLPAREGEPSEFYTLTYRQCLQAIREAKKELSIKTRHFVAPWNHYTDELHDALAIEGFDSRWTGPENGGNPPGLYGGSFINIPCWRTLSGAFRWKMGPEDQALLDVIPGVSDRPGKAVACLHITWEGCKGEDFRGVREFVQKFSECVITPDEYLNGK
jgi:hypothetical protein